MSVVVVGFVINVVVVGMVGFVTDVVVGVAVVGAGSATLCVCDVERQCGFRGGGMRGLKVKKL